MLCVVGRIGCCRRWEYIAVKYGQNHVGAMRCYWRGSRDCKHGREGRKDTADPPLDFTSYAKADMNSFTSPYICEKAVSQASLAPYLRRAMSINMAVVQPQAEHGKSTLYHRYLEIALGPCSESMRRRGP